MQNFARTATAALSAVVVVVAISACGSSSSSSHDKTAKPSRTGTSPSSGSPSSSGTSGVGYTSPTAPSGAKISGGTVTFSEGPGAPPNYIFPMVNPQVCSTTNISQLQAMLYRPLYWFGNNYSPTVDYGYSIGRAPVFSSNDETVTISLNPWKWSDGESVTARDIEFWIDMYKADPAKNYCGYVPGFFPDNVKSMSSPNPTTLVLHLTKAFDPEWFLYNELSQIYPLPLAWDRTSLSQPAPTSDNGHLADSTKSGAESVYSFLDTQSKDLGSWATSPVWGVVDGPFKLQSFTTQGEVTMVPNPSYSGSPKPMISKFVELPFTSGTAVYDEIRAGGPSALSIASLPSQYAPQIPTVEGEGYLYSRAASYGFNYFPFNFNNPTIGPLFRQLYFRQAFQHLIDQSGWINAFLDKTAELTTGPIPASPASPLASASSVGEAYPFSTSAASALLTQNGWRVAPGGATTCVRPGSSVGDCGAGIKPGEGISFNLDYESGVASVASEMNDLLAEAKRVGINIDLTSHPFGSVIGALVACQPSQPTCKWTAQNWGGGWIYGPDYLPTGESLFYPGAAANYGSFSDPIATKLINATIYGPLSQEQTALTAYDRYMAKDLPVVYGPTSIGTYQGNSAGTVVNSKLGGYAANALGFPVPEDYYLTH